MRTVDNAIYDRIDDDWWSDDSFMALLRNAVNPPRFAYFRDALERLGRTPASLELLDVGCGGGLLAEEFADLGCRVTGVDRSMPTLAVARKHAKDSALDIRYERGSAEALPFDAARFDIVCCCDVLEHVDDVERVVGEIARVLKPGGIFFFDTINRTWLSKLLAIKAAQDWAPTRLVPRDVHVWEQFVRPRDLAAVLERRGFGTCELVGLSPALRPFSALASLVRLKLGLIDFGEMGRALKLAKSRNLSLSYMGYATRSVAATGT
jgi:2-polyprenyl-6-hydroxyphenyl methylase / 3-demethylubiquinone-9 3-methyltransferase